MKREILEMRASKRDKFKKYTLAEFVFSCGIRKAMRKNPRFYNGSSGTLILVVPDGATPDDYVKPACMLVEPLSNDSRFNESIYAVVTIEKEDSPREAAKKLLRLASKPKAILFAENQDEIPPEFLLQADAVISIEPPSPSHLAAGCRVLFGIKITEQQAAEVLSYPLTAVWSAIKKYRPICETLEKLKAYTPAKPVPTLTGPNPRRLEDMHGYGSAKQWGLNLAADIAAWKAGELDWEDVDKGLLLSGPPGCGKTIFAEALATTCGVALVASSLAQWQARGHLGDMLKAMRADFAKAVKNAPSILFIDELDSAGDRNTLQGDNASYGIQVINALLECIDGSGGRQGVVVIGATNNPQSIDIAILRSGRLDKHVVIPYPGFADRCKILSEYVGDSIDTESLKPIAKVLEGFTGADIAQIVRDAKRNARRSKSKLSISHIQDRVPATIKLTESERYLTAIHEAGHAIVGLQLDVGQPESVTIKDSFIPHANGSDLGITVFKFPNQASNPRQYYLNHIAMLMAGMAAEKVIFGDIYDGAGGGEGSDLQRAADLASEMVAEMGMGDNIAYFTSRNASTREKLRRENKIIEAGVNKILTEQLARSEAILVEQEDKLKSFADRLCREGILNIDDICQILNGKTECPITIAVSGSDQSRFAQKS